MEILQLRYFFESARTGSFAKTAEHFHVPATSVSASVKRLEKELGCELFRRTCNRIILNDQGKRLQQSLYIVFDELEKAVESLASAAADTRQIKMLVRTTRTEITDVVIAYKQKHPQVAFKTVFDFTGTDYEEYDIVIDEEKDAYPGYEKLPLCSTRIRIRAAADSPLCGRKLTLRQLQEHAFISIGEQNSMNQILVDACKKAGFTPQIAIQCNDIKCYEKCLAAGVGIGLGREFPNAIQAENVACLDVTDFNKTQTICSYYKKQAAYGNVKNFLDFLKRTL